MKTYHMYHTESISAESKLKDAEKQEEKQFSKSGDLNVNLLRHEDRQPRRSSVRKIEKMKEKVYIYICLHKFRSVCAVKSWIISFTFRLGKTFKQLMVSQLSLSGVLGNIERWVDQQLDRKSQEHTVGLQPDEYFRPITPLPFHLIQISSLWKVFSTPCWALRSMLNFRYPYDAFFYSASSSQISSCKWNFHHLSGAENQKAVSTAVFLHPQAGILRDAA